MNIKISGRIWGSKSLTILYVFAVSPAIFGILIEKPENTAVLLSDTAIIKCKSDKDLKLQWHSYGNNSQEEVLWNGYFLNQKACSCPCCAIDNHEPGKYNLNITARRETAKRYRCTEPGTLTRVSADLIVIESPLKCTYNELENEVKLSCTIGYHGEWTPQINWSESDEVQVDETSVSAKNGQVISTLIKSLTRYEVFYTAAVYFRETDKPVEVTATNVPNYVDEWKSPSFKRHVSENTTLTVVLCCIAIGLVLAGGVIAGLVMLKRKKSRKITEESVPAKKKYCIKDNEGAPALIIQY